MTEPDADPEIEAMRQLIAALTPLDTDGRFRVIGYVFSRLGIEWTNLPPATETAPHPAARSEHPALPPATLPAANEHPGDDRAVAAAETPIAAPPPGGEPANRAKREKPVDIRTFAKSKSPASNSEKAAVVAYYLAHVAPDSEHKEVIKGADIEKYFGLVPFETTLATRQILYQAKNAGYLEPVSTGAYRLNTIGFNLVDQSLPRAKK